MIGSWFANKIVQLVVGALGIVGVILIPVTISQAVDIHGFLWWGGLKDKVAVAEKAQQKAESYLAIQTGNVDTLKRGLSTCNASIDGLKSAGAKATAEAKANLAKLNAAQAALDAARRRLAAVPGSTQACPSVDAIFSGAFQ